MGFFNDLGKKTTETTNKITREAKLKMKINENKTKIKELYEQLGKKVYEKYVREEDIKIKDFIDEECSNINNLSKEIKEARKKILLLNHKRMCKKCFAEIGTDAVFCPKCGVKQLEEKTAIERAEEKIETSDISLENKKEAEIIKEELKEKNNEE